MNYITVSRKYAATALSDVREKFEQELENNARLKWIIGAGILILYISFVVYLANQANEAQSKYLSSQSRLAQLENQIEDQDWRERANAAAALTESLTARFWPGDTPGLAEAGFERWIRRTLERHGIDVRQVQLTRRPILESQSASDDEVFSEVERIRAKVIGPLSEAAIVRFLDDAASHEAWLIVEQFVARGGRSDRFEMDLSTFYRP